MHFTAFISLTCPQSKAPGREVMKLLWASSYKRRNLIEKLVSKYGPTWAREARGGHNGTLSALDCSLRELSLSWMSPTLTSSSPPTRFSFDPLLFSYLSNDIGVEWTAKTTRCALAARSSEARRLGYSNSKILDILRGLAYNFQTQEFLQLLNNHRASVPYQVDSELLFIAVARTPDRTDQSVDTAFLDEYTN